MNNPVLTIASGNKTKVSEISAMLDVLTLKVQKQPEYLNVEETGETYFENALLKAANEAEKASNITVVDVKAVGAFGRLTLAGKEGDVEEAAAAAIRAIDEISNY